MPTRTINLKLIRNKTSKGKELSSALWTTHTLLNAAISRVESILLLCRGRSFNRLGDDDERITIREEDVAEKTLAFAREVQEKNIQKEVGTDAEVLAILTEFYQDLVPSVSTDESGNPLKGNAQTSANTWSGPIYDPNSEGGLKVFDRIVEPLPAWVEKKKADDPAWEEESVSWLLTDEAKRVRSATGRPSGWILRLRDGRPWQDSFIEDQEKKRKKVKGTPMLMMRMRDMGLLPMLSPPVYGLLNDTSNRSSKTRWDTLAIRLAIEHLLSWESWNHRARAEHLKVQKQLKMKQERLAKESSEAVSLLNKYEQDRHDSLQTISFASDEPFRINMRMIRAWNQVHEAFSRCNGKEKERINVLNELQTKMSGRFGDPDLFRWIAQDGNEVLWKNPDTLPLLAICNATGRLKERTKDCALYTSPEPRLHPRSIQYEAVGGSNLYNYSLQDEDGSIVVRLQLLSRDTNDDIGQKVYTFTLAPSGQFSNPLVTTTKQNQRVRYFCANQIFQATLGGAFILFDRDFLTRHRVEEMDQGNIGDAWLKLTLDVDSMAPKDWLDGKGRVATPAEVHHFKTALSNKSKHTESLKPGLRVLSVDLGMRQLAACSVFELVSGKPARGTCFPAVPEKNLWAKQERTFMLRLPGENPTESEAAAREEAYSQVRTLRRGLIRLRTILRLSVLEERNQRVLAIDDIKKAVFAEMDQGQDPSIPFEEVFKLMPSVESSSEDWSAAVEEVYRSAERVLSERISAWRKSTRPRRDFTSRDVAFRDYAPGKSAWAIDYLDQVRRLLAGWSRHGRSYGQVNRASREAQGIFASNLLAHINGLKEDRIKSGVDLIIQAARGYEPRHHGKGWIKKYDPCRIIIFEDLARYRFRTDRPRRENSQLMQWAHREIISEAELQAELYGIVIESIGAGYSSRFHARTMAPGVRARKITESDLNRPWMRTLLERQCDTLGIEKSKLVPDLLLPWDGGEWFVTLGKKGRPFIENADINASVNLQRRFWNRHADAYRLTAVRVESEGQVVEYYPNRINLRTQGALATATGGSGFAKLVGSRDDRFKLENISKAAWTSLSGQAGKTDDEPEPEEEQFSIKGGPETLFHDSSGLVMNTGTWYRSRDFWGTVKGRITQALLT